MITRPASLLFAIAMLLTLSLPLVIPVAQGLDASTPEAVVEVVPPPAETVELTTRPIETIGADTTSAPGETAAAEEFDFPTTLATLANQVQPAAETATAIPASVEVYCDPVVTDPTKNTVGAIVPPRPGYGVPTVTFTLFNLAGSPIPVPIGLPPLPALNPITAFPPAPGYWEWGPGDYSKITVSADYPSNDPANYPNDSVLLTIACVSRITPTATATHTPTHTPVISPTPFPTRTAVGFTPVFKTTMRDSAGNVIPNYNGTDGIVLPGTVVYDTAEISGLPPNFTGTVYYRLFQGLSQNWCFNQVSYFGTFVITADPNGVAIVPDSDAFTVPASPGGWYNWIIELQSGAYYASPGCLFETFFVEPPPTPTPTLTPFGDGTARITCFAGQPPEPGKAGYKVNVTSTSNPVEVYVTLKRTDNVNEFKTVLLPPGTDQDLQFYGPYTQMWANVVYRDSNGDIFSVVNLEGQCEVTPGATYTPSVTPTRTPTVTATSTTAAATLTSTATPGISTETPGNQTFTATSTVVLTATETPDSRQTATLISTPAETPAGEVTSVPVTLPKTGNGSRAVGWYYLVVCLAVSLSVLYLATRRQRRE